MHKYIVVRLKESSEYFDNSPSKLYDEILSAQTEAARLAAIHVGKKFLVAEIHTAYMGTVRVVDVAL